MTAFALTEPQRAFAAQVRAIAAEQLRRIAEAGTPGRGAAAGIRGRRSVRRGR
jgi:hypothetical protein